MIETGWLWVVFTVIAAGAQTARNAMQRELTVKLGTVGATHVRFLFGFPFAALSLFFVLIVTGADLPSPPAAFWPWVLTGAVTQIAGTALMLAAMGERSFVVVTALLKTEAVQVAVFGFIFLSDRLSGGATAAIVIATLGVVLMSIANKDMLGAAGLRPILTGLGAGAIFALSAVTYRGAILSLSLPDFVVAATFTLAVGLLIQAAMLSFYLMLRDPGVMTAILRSWRQSLFAGFMGALSSQFWFLAFALATAASVRTLALIELLFAQLFTRFAFKQKLSAREGLGIALVAGGVLLLLWTH
ncbi:MAG: EamA/RhaT family transporter [Pseudorhodoplanes sp.]